MTVYDLTLDELSSRLAAWNEPPYRARQVYAGLWRRAATYREMTDLPAPLRGRLGEELPRRLEVVQERSADAGETVKVLLRVGRRHLIESVLMAYPDRVTLCVSSQAGCAMACDFCATGRMGLLGNLSPGEIAAQVVWGRREAASRLRRRLTNVVFMGMGEPLSNYRGTSGAIDRLLDPAGLGLSARHVTVSTVGVVPGILRLADEHPKVGLAVSLHAADDVLRDRLVPANRLWPIDELEAAVARWRERTGRRPSIEWAMMAGVNDGLDQARSLGPIARRLRAHVNLIPMNPIAGSPYRPSPPGRVRTFVEALLASGVNATVRDTRGREIEAACGQFRLGFGRRPAPLTVASELSRA